jgi:hypothetical protein
MHAGDVDYLSDEIKPFRTPCPHTWFAVSRKIFEHEVVGTHVKAPPAADPKRQTWQPTVAWLWMLGEAAFQNRRVLIKNNMIHLDRGQFVCSERHLARMANWNRKAAHCFLARLSAFDMVSLSGLRRQGEQFLLDFSGQKKGPDITVVTIRNYDIYQFAAPQQGASKGPARGQIITSDKGTKDLHRSLTSKNKQARSDLDASLTDGALPFTTEVIEALVDLEVDVEKTIEAYRKRTVGKRILDPSAYLLKMGRTEYAKRHSITIEQVKAITSRNKAAKVTAMANVVGAFSKPSDKTLARAARNTPNLVDKALALMAGRSFTSQDATDRAFDGHLANLRFKK